MATKGTEMENTNTIRHLGLSGGKLEMSLRIKNVSIVPGPCLRREIAVCLRELPSLHHHIRLLCALHVEPILLLLQQAWHQLECRMWFLCSSNI